DLPRPLASFLEFAHSAMKYHEITHTRRPGISIAICLRESLFIELPNQVFVQRDLKLCRQLDIVGLDHFDLYRRDFTLGSLFFLGKRGLGGEKQDEQRSPNCGFNRSSHCFGSFSAGLLDGAFAASCSSVFATWAPCATSNFLIGSAP